MPMDRLQIAQTHPFMPDFIREELTQRNLLGKFLSHNQAWQDEYINWIDTAPKPSVRDKRLADLVFELKQGIEL